MDNVIGRSPEIVLREAAAYIERHGWCQEEFRNASGSVCALEAIDEVTGFGSTQVGRDEYDAAQELLGKRVGNPNPAVWNDAAGRTKEEVLAVLRGEL